MFSRANIPFVMIGGHTCFCLTVRNVVGYAMRMNTISKNIVGTKVHCQLLRFYPNVYVNTMVYPLSRYMTVEDAVIVWLNLAIGKIERISLFVKSDSAGHHARIAIIVSSSCLYGWY